MPYDLPSVRQPVPLWQNNRWVLPGRHIGLVNVANGNRGTGWARLYGLTPWELIAQGTGPVTVGVVVSNREDPPVLLSVGTPLVTLAFAAGTALQRWAFDIPVEWV